jgi:hypothetical protein
MPTFLALDTLGDVTQVEYLLLCYFAHCYQMTVSDEGVKTLCKCTCAFSQVFTEGYTSPNDRMTYSMRWCCQHVFGPNF